MLPLFYCKFFQNIVIEAKNFGGRNWEKVIEKQEGEKSGKELMENIDQEKRKRQNSSRLLKANENQELISELSKFLTQEEVKKYLKLSNSPNPVTSFRINLLRNRKDKIFDLLHEEGFEFKQFPSIPNAYVLTNEPFALGASLSHFVGNIYIQDLSSMIPPLMLDLDKDDLVLDMCSAPGSKTTQIGELMENRGLVIANDVSSDRSRFLSHNILRIGLANTIIMNIPGNRFGKLYFEKFDKILVDPPCSGLGTLRSHPEVIRWWKKKFSKKYANTQFGLLVSAIKAAKVGGIIVYSTCTIMPLENEEVVKRVLDKYPVEIEHIDFKGFKVRRGIDLEEAIRIYPFENIGEGFFVAKLKKVDSIKQSDHKNLYNKLDLVDKSHHSVKDSINFLIDYFEIPENIFENFLFEKTKDIRIISKKAKDFNVINYTQRGIPVIKVDSKRVNLTTWGAMFFGRYAKKNVIDFDDPLPLRDYLKKIDLQVASEEDGIKIIKYRGHTVGHGEVKNGILKSKAKLRSELSWPFRIFLKN